MERSLFAFIWKYSRRDQLYLLAFTLFTFPFLYVTLELPKRIINDAIGADSDIIDVFGYEVSQVQFLMTLCFGYLAAVLVHGLLKMRLNTMKGVLAERMLRRFRYQLLNRMMLFPRSYYQNTSQGELVSMVTSEAEPMGGLMGDAVAQPVFQAGQMAIIVLFLFLQSFWFGLAGVALIPLQAYVIPLLQRQINLLNKERIGEVRLLAGEIGETAAGITDLRTNGGWRLRLAQYTDRLGRLFDVRFRIYQKKFFMKFLNNFITQLTPFFFYSVGGYLAIKGEITVGALVAALAAYKDLSSPWKELLTYYNQTQDMSLRWDIVTERFAPRNMIDEDLISGQPDEIPHLRGDIELENVTVRNMDGNLLLEDVSLTIPAGSRVAMEIPAQSERTAFAEVLTREILPVRGKVTLAGHDVSTLHQSVLAARIGYARAQPYLFRGSVGDNLLMPLRTSPKTVLWDPKHLDRTAIEAFRSGNSLDSTKADWLDPALADLDNSDDIYRWWFQVVEALGTGQLLFERMMHQKVDPEQHPELTARLVGLRDEVHARLQEDGLDKVVYRMDPERFNPAVPLGGNLMFAAPRRNISIEGLAGEKAFLGMVMEHGLGAQIIAISQTLVETLRQTFGRDGTGHPLFTALDIEEALYERLVEIATRRREKGDAALTEEEFTLLLTVPFAFTAEQIGPTFPESFKEEILEIRRAQGPALRERAKEMFIPIEYDTYIPRLTILENLLFGRISAVAGLQADLVQDVVADVLRKHDLRRDVATMLFDIPTSIGGSNLNAIFQERAAIGRAVIKRPDLMIFDRVLDDQDAEARSAIRDRLQDLLPEATQIYLDDKFENPQDFDIHVVIRNGHVDGLAETDTMLDEASGSEDLRRKMRILARADLFSDLDARNQRLLAFAAQWYEVEPGTRIFTAGDRPDAAYLCLSGLGEMGYTDEDGVLHHVTNVEPGRLIGDLAVLIDEPRQLDLVAVEKTKFLRIGADQFRAVVEGDNTVLLSLLKTVGGHLTGAAERLIASGIVINPDEQSPAPPITAKAESR